MAFRVPGWRVAILPLPRHERSSLQPHSQLGDVGQAVQAKRCFDALLKLSVQTSEALL